MKKLILFILGAILLSFVFAGEVSAATWEVSEDVDIMDPVYDDLYLMGGRVTVNDDVFGDLYVMGGVVSINGDVGGDLVILGGKANIFGDVGGDLRIVGGQAVIAGSVDEDLVLSGGQVDLVKSGDVGGSVLAGAGIFTMDGKITGDMRGGLGILILNGFVGGDVVVTIEDKISVDKEARVGGDFKYSAIIETSIDESVVDGDIKFYRFERENIMSKLNYLFFIEKTFSFLASLVLLALAVGLFPRALIRAGEIAKENVFKSFGVGLLTTILAIIVSFILTTTIVGISLAMIISAGFMIALFLSKIFAAAWALHYIVPFKKKKIRRLKMFGIFALALFAYYLLGVIPFVGWIINIILFMIGMGAIVNLKIEYYGILKSKKLV